MADDDNTRPVELDGAETPPPDKGGTGDVPTASTGSEPADAGGAVQGASPVFESSEPRHSERIGQYRIKRPIASGGMGTVYLAQQESPRRIVALKVMKKGIASRSALRRFEFESQILARLHHPNIAQVYESGTHDDGEGGIPFFVMEYIPNAKPIIKYAQDNNLCTNERLELFVKVCAAVHHGPDQSSGQRV